LRLVTYKPLFSGPAVERVPELEFQRPEPDIELAPDDARQLGILNGQEVTVRSNGTAVQLRARLVEDLAVGAARVAEGFAAGLEGRVEVTP
jgi:anaerobic selenocysteine-containing dehydrogenase